MPEVVEELGGQDGLGDVRLTMTDRYPNPDVVERFASAGRDYVRYWSEPVDATDLASAPPGLKTMVNCFHHMRPRQARSILRSARENREPLLIYEMGENKLPFWVWCVSLPVGLPLVGLMALAMTPLVRPLTFRQLFFTYVIPVVPVCYAWDGQASMPRIYSEGDLDELLADLHGDGYRWEKGPATLPSGRAVGTYLLGLPTGRAKGND